MDENKIVLCGANAYEKKYYFNEEQFKMISSMRRFTAATVAASAVCRSIVA